ncbi:MAG: DUF4198 domain-containing protein, partial [Gemmatimonadota bacterium]
MLSAHDFWVVPQLFRVPEGWAVHVAGQTGMDFPESLSAIEPGRVAEAELVSSDARIPVEKSFRSGNSLMMEARPEDEGQWWVAVALESRPIRLSQEQFNSYLEHDGVWDVLEERRAAESLPTDSVDERYTKYAKALVQVGEGGPDAYGRRVGHPIEFVPLEDPFELRPGDRFRARLLWRGEPLAKHVVFAGRAGAGEGPTTHARTNDEGVVEFPLFVSGPWYLKAIHMAEAPDDPELEYRSHWATLTFDV